MRKPFTSRAKVNGTSAGGSLKWGPPALVGACILLQVVPTWATALEYDRAAIAGWQWWRLLTWHLAHWSWDHLIWDVGTFAVLSLVCHRLGLRRYWLCLVSSALTISLVTWYAQPEFEICRGLSGPVSALFALVVTSLFWRARQRQQPGAMTFCLVLLGLFMGKTLYESLTAATLFVDSAQALMIPMPLAHLVGALVGAILASGRSSFATEPTDEARIEVPGLEAAPVTDR